MFNLKKVALAVAAVMLSSSPSASAVVQAHEEKDAAAASTTSNVEYMQKVGHNPNLSPEEIMKQRQAKTTTTKTEKQNTLRAAVKEKEPKPVAVSSAEQGLDENRRDYYNEVINHVNNNLGGHNPNLSPEQIYAQIRRAKNESQ